MQFLEDEGAVPTPEEDVTREQVIRKLKKVINRGRGKISIFRRVFYLSLT
jgi:hypothetical protein